MSELLPHELFNSLVVLGAAVILAWVVRLIISWIRIGQLENAFRRHNLFRIDPAAAFLLDNEFPSFQSLLKFLKNSPKTRPMSIPVLRPALKIRSKTIEFGAAGECETISIGVIASAEFCVQTLVGLSMKSVNEIINSCRHRMQSGTIKETSRISDKASIYPKLSIPSGTNLGTNLRSTWEEIFHQDFQSCSSLQSYERDCTRVQLKVPPLEERSTERFHLALCFSDDSKSTFGESGHHQLLILDRDTCNVVRHILSENEVVVDVDEVFGIEESNDCSVCLSEYADCIALPCRHFGLCRTCIQQVDKCPICRCDITRILYCETEALEVSRANLEEETPQL